MFGNLVRSLRKSRRIRRISKVLGANVLSVYDLSSDKNKKDQALNELYDLCEADPVLSQVLANYSPNREQLKAIYIALIANGAGQWARGHYVAASAFAFAPTLEYVLGARPEGQNLSEMAYQLVDYFERGETGPVE